MAYLEVEGDVTGLVLPSGHVALVDTADVPLVSNHRWFIRRSKADKLYVRGYLVGGLNDATLHLHRVVLGLDTEIDHINGDGLDNRRANLRPATHAQNVYNARGRVGSSSPYKGVSWYAGKWRARIRIDGKYLHLGRFADPWEAAQAYNTAAFQAWGDYAWLNQRQET